MSGSQRPPGYLPPHLRVMTPPTSSHASRSSSIASRLTQPAAVKPDTLQTAKLSTASSQSSDSSDQTVKSAKLGENVTSTTKTESRLQPAIPFNSSSKPSTSAAPALPSKVKSVTSGDTPPHLRSLRAPLTPVIPTQSSTSSAGTAHTMEQMASTSATDMQSIKSTKTETPVTDAVGASIKATTWQQLGESAGQPSKERTTRKPVVDVVAKSAKNYPCSYVDCPTGFDTLRGLKYHKAETHDYCKVCDMDFKDGPEFLKHKIKSEKHIVCPICSEDFKSSMGRDRHLKQVKSPL